MATGYSIRPSRGSRRHPGSLHRTQRRPGSLRNLPPLCGVYQIEHMASGRVYIGASHDIHSRWLAHKSDLRLGTHHCHRLQADWNRDGLRAFFFAILTLCAPEDLMREEATAQRACTLTYS